MCNFFEENLKSPYVIMLVGLPATGKSTFVKNFLKRHVFTLVSSDDYIEWIANRNGKTYNEVFKDHMKDAEKHTLDCANFAIENNQNVVWDQTNLSSKVRKNRLNMFPEHYQKIAIVFQIPRIDIWKNRLDSRPGKTIPETILQTMIKNFSMPTQQERFDIVSKYDEIQFENDIR